MAEFNASSKRHWDQSLSSNALLVTEQDLADSKQEFHRPWKPWKPWTLSAGALISIGVFTGALAIMLGILQWQSTRHGALLFASTADGFTFSENFLYRYLPTIIVVLYGLFWSWIDLDIKRLEPWFQLARKGGAPADKSLLLQYPVDFMPLVPFKATKLWQWTVVSVSAVMILVSWGVVPLQNGIFSSGTIVVSSATALRTTNSFLPVDDQSAKIGGNILNSAYSIACRPGSNVFTSTQTLTAATLLYSTELTCRPPSNVIITGPDLTFDDGQGCIAQDLLPVTDEGLGTRFVAYFIGYYDDANVDADLQLAGCPISSSHEFLAMWKLTSGSPPELHNSPNSTAMFCTPKYYSQSVNATVTLPDQKVMSTLPLGPKVELTEKQFNITHFEYLVANGIPAPTPSSPRDDISELTNVHQDSRLLNMSLPAPTANMIGFAVGTTHLEPEAYLNPSNLQMALQRAHRLLFSLAVQAILQPSLHDASASGYITSQVQGVTLVPVFTYLSEGLLGLIVIFTVYLVYTMPSRPSALVRDPDSLAQVMSLSRHPDMQRLFMPLDAANDLAISKILQSVHFEMLASQDQPKPVIKQNSKIEHEMWGHRFRDLDGSIAKQEMLSDKHLTRPLEYNCAIGSLFLAVLASMITILVWVHEKIHSDDGLPLPSQSLVVQQIILNLLPTVAATSMEPVWILLTRIACMMRPLEELKAGRVRARKSLTLNYTALPAQLLPWRALRTGHVLLAALCTVTILANLLTVALSGLFRQADVFRAQHIQLEDIYQHDAPLNGTDLVPSSYTRNDPFYVAMANFSGVASLPPWTSAEYGFYPLDLGTGLSGDGSTYLELQTMGYGLDMDCHELTETPSDATYNLTFSPDASLAKLVLSYKQSNGSEILCIPYSAVLNSSGAPFGERFMPLSGNPEGFQAFEFAGPLKSCENVFNNPDFIASASTNSVVDAASFCNNLVVRGWVRANTTVQPAPVSSTSGGSASSTALPGISSMTLSQTFISCQPRIKSALFDLRVSSSGSIMTAIQNSSVLYGQTAWHSSLWTTLDHTTAAFIDSFPAWHNDTFASDWFNDLAKAFTHSTALLDVNVPPPNVFIASRLTSELYSRIFAIQMSLQYPSLLPATADSKPVPARQMTSERRVFMSEPLFYISITILVVDLLVAIVFYWHATAAFLPRMPTSIANQIAFFAGSHVIDDVVNAGGDLQELDSRGYRYGYGRHVGKDGKVHLGIEREPYVMHSAKQRIAAAQ